LHFYFSTPFLQCFSCIFLYVYSLICIFQSVTDFCVRFSVPLPSRSPFLGCSRPLAVLSATKNSTGSLFRAICAVPYSLHKKKSGSEEPPSHNSGYAIKRSRVSRSLSSLCCLDLLDQFGHDLEQVAHDAVVGNTEDGCALILVDSDDALGVLHTSGVLDSTGDA